MAYQSKRLKFQGIPRNSKRFEKGVWIKMLPTKAKGWNSKIFQGVSRDSKKGFGLKCDLPKQNDEIQRYSKEFQEF